MATVRRADATWNGDLAIGRGVVTATNRGSFKDLPVSWASRTECPDGRTSPEELVPAVHAAPRYCMALSDRLSGDGTPQENLKVSASVTFVQLDGRWKVSSSALTVDGQVPGIDQAGFQKTAEGAKDGCPLFPVR